MLVLGRKKGESILFDYGGQFGGLFVVDIHSDWVMLKLWRDHRGKTAPFAEHGLFQSIPQGVFKIRPTRASFIHPSVEVSINELRDGKVMLGINAPKSVLVIRTEKLMSASDLAKVPEFDDA